METIYAVINGDDTDGEKIRQAGEILKAGGLVAFPTETVYGLGGDALNPDSSRKIYAAKGRPSDNPLIVHICRWEDIYRIAEMIARQSDVTVLVVKDYIKNPKPNGYKSYHMVVTIPIYLSDGPVDTKVEIQIRTIAMDFWASLEHKIYYKFEGNAPDYLEQELKACADMADMLDNKMFSLNQAITKIAEEQAKEKEAAKVAEEMKKAEREDVPAGNEQEPKDGKRSGEAASGNRKEAGE